jgi:hypothetical protein
MSLRFCRTPHSGPTIPTCNLAIRKSFHQHLMKCVVMICQGHVPIVGMGKNPTRMNADVVSFLRYFLPKGEKLTLRSAGKVVKYFHLAFQGMDTGEVYDVLMGLLVEAINKYDPGYTLKVRRVVGVIENALSKQRQFRLADVNRHLEFDSNRYLRLLCRTGFLKGKIFQEEVCGRFSGATA